MYASKRQFVIAAVVVGVVASRPVSAQQFNYIYNISGSGAIDTPTVAIPTTDGGYALVGYGRQTNGQAYLLKLDKDGNTSWMKQYGSNIRFLAIRQITSGTAGYVLVGWAKIGTTLQERPVLLRTLSDGSVSWGRYFQALDAGGDDADTARATAVIIDSTDNKFVVGGYACDIDNIAPQEHCRPFIAKLTDSSSIGAPDWLKSYYAEFFPESKLYALAQPSTHSIVAAATSYTWDLIDTPLVIGVEPNGTSDGVYEYSVSNVTKLTLEDVSIDNDHTSYARLVGTATTVVSPTCSQDMTNPDCGRTLGSTAWSGLAYADPNDSMMGFGTASNWRTYRDVSSVSVLSYGHRVTAGPSDGGFFIGGRAEFATAVTDIDALLIKVPTNLMGYSGMRYGDGWGAMAPVTTRVESLAYVPSGANWSQGLLMSVDVRDNSSGYYGMNLIRSDLTGDCGSCQTEVDVYSQALSPSRTSIAHNTRSWEIANWTPDDDDPDPTRQSCGDVY